MKPIEVPRISANEDLVEVVEIGIVRNQACTRGQTLCLLQSTKATWAVQAEEDGYAVLLVDLGSRVTVGQVIGYFDVRPMDLSSLSQPSANGSVTPTRRAAELLARHGLDASQVKARGILRAQEVEAWLEASVPSVTAPQGDDADYQALERVMKSYEHGEVGIAEVARLKQVLALAAELYARRWNREVPVADLLFDRWATAERAGAGPGSSIHHLSYRLGKVQIGRNTFVGPFTVLDGSGGLSIGDHCSIAAGVHIYSHDTIARALSGHRAEVVRAPTRIGNCCFIGPHAVVAKGVTIGDHCLVSANSLVTSDVPPFSIVQGNPSRIVGQVRLAGDGGVMLEPRPVPSGEKGGTHAGRTG